MSNKFYYIRIGAFTKLYLIDKGKMKTLILVLVFYCISFPFTSVYSQHYKITRYADDNGLPSRIVRDVTQDKEGFIWVAGNNGLYKFDGQKFKPYLASLKDTIGLRDNRINAIIESADNKIWVGTPKGLHVLDENGLRHVKLIENPTDHQEYVLNIFEDTEQNMWVGTYGGLFLLEKSREAIHFLSEGIETSLAEDVIWGVSQDADNSIWITTKSGPYVLLEGDNFSFKKLQVDFGDDKELHSANIYGFKQYKDSLLLIDSNSGLLKGIMKNDSTILVSHFKNPEGNRVANYVIERSIIDNKNNIWIGTAKNSFKKYKILSGRLAEVEVVVKNGLLNISGNTKSVYQDSQGSIWLANTNGLYKLSEIGSEITTFPPKYIDDCLKDLYGIYAMIEDKGGHFWMTTPTHLYRFKKSDLLKGRCPKDYFVFENEHMQLARYLQIDSQYRLWIGADEGLFVTQLDKNHNPGKFIRYTKSNGLPHNRSYDILEEDENNFWIGNYAGLVKLTLNGGNLDNPEVQVYTANEDNPGTLVNTQAIDLEKDKDGNLWIGTFSGVSRLIDGNSPGSFENFTSSHGHFESLSNNSVKKIFKDSRDRLWIATQRGLNLYMPDNNQFIQFGHDEGLPSEYVLGIQEDSNENLWVGTTNGAIKSRYDNESHRLNIIDHYTSRNGLADNIPYRNSILIDADDNVFIGSREGISVFNNATTTITDQNFNLAITNLESTERKKRGFKSIIKKIKDGELVLSHFENSIKINYAALDFLDPENNRYRHKLLPINDSWIETGSSSELSFYNLLSGEYEFILDGSNGMGIWSKSPIKLKLIIKPPFWKSIWALVLYVILVAALLRFLYLFRIRKKVRQLEHAAQLEKALLIEREQLRQENAADFHDELGSKVTKISLFLTLAERSLKENDNPLPWFEKIRDNIKGLSGGFRDLLWVIDPQKDSLDDTFLRLKDFGEDLFEKSDIDFRTKMVDAKYAENFLNAQTKKQVVMIFKEAMNNCLKYSQAQNAELKLESKGEYSSIRFMDDGIGFDVSLKSKGRGLRNMMARAKKIGALLKIESSPKGTTISLHRIPHTSDRFKLQDA